MIPRELIGPLRAALPDADLDAATALGEGWAQVALRVPASGGDFVLRHPLLRNYDNAQHPDLRAMAIADLEREAKLLPELLAHGLPVPTEMLLLRDNDGRTIGSIHRLLEGDPITRSMLVGGRRKRLATALAEFFTRLHSFPSDRTTEPGLKSIGGLSRSPVGAGPQERLRRVLLALGEFLSQALACLSRLAVAPL